RFRSDSRTPTRDRAASGRSCRRPQGDAAADLAGDVPARPQLAAHRGARNRTPRRGVRDGPRGHRREEGGRFLRRDARDEVADEEQRVLASYGSDGSLTLDTAWLASIGDLTVLRSGGWAFSSQLVGRPCPR